MTHVMSSSATGANLGRTMRDAFLREHSWDLMIRRLLYREPHVLITDQFAGSEGNSNESLVIEFKPVPRERSPSRVTKQADKELTNRPEH